MLLMLLSKWSKVNYLNIDWILMVDYFDLFHGQIKDITSILISFDQFASKGKSVSFRQLLNAPAQKPLCIHSPQLLKTHSLFNQVQPSVPSRKLLQTASLHSHFNDQSFYTPLTYSQPNAPSLLKQLFQQLLLYSIIICHMEKVSLYAPEHQYKEYGYRIPIVAIFCLLSFVNGMCWVVVSPISVPIGRAYSQPDTVVSIIPMCYMIIYVFVNFPSNWVLDVRGIKKGIVVGAVLTSIGAAFRCLITTHFAFVIVGQVICAIGQPFILNAPTKIAVRWFLPQSRSVALAILSVANIVGTAVGFLLPPFFVQDNDSNDLIQSSFTALLLFQFFASLFPLTMVLLWFRESPPTAASPSNQVVHLSYTNGIKILFKDRRFLGLLFSFGMVLGTFNIYGSLLDNVLDCFGYTTDEVSYLAASMMIVGIISAALFGLYIERTLKYYVIFKVLAFLGVVVCVGLPLVIGFLKYNFPIALLLISMMGVIFIPMMPLSFDYGCDILFPAGEAQITGCLMASGNLVGVIMILISQIGFGLGDPDNTTEQNQNASLKSVIAVSIMLGSGIFLYFFYNSELKRSKLDKERREGSLLSIQK